MAKSSAKTKASTLRIIGGEWRGRKLQFFPAEGLRPTNDRIRETLFNWLMHEIPAARCLDLFTGSGALGLEALSRGASEVTFIDNNKPTIQQIKTTLKMLEASQGKAICTDALKYIQQEKPEKPLDIIFLDPPFHKNMVPTALELLSNNNWLTDSTLLYIEIENEPSATSQLPSSLLVKKEKAAGQVKSILATMAMQSASD